MTNNAIVQVQGIQGLNVPAAFHSLMNEMQNSELQSNVGTSFAVVSFKGKVFNIRYGGTSTPITVEMNGATYAAPFMDVVIIKAKAELSKTWYKHGYVDGSEDAPDCWAEDGVTPLAPLSSRPIDPRTGGPCTDCRLCPMNEFGSKVSANPNEPSKGKACADTRKLVVVPVGADGRMDAVNAKFGGPMLLRVPAASLRVFAEYDAKLQAMGVPYFAVVTQLEFDQTQAFPKFQLKAKRVLTDAEAMDVVRLRDSMQVRQMLDSGHAAAAAPNESVAAVAGQAVPAALQQATTVPSPAAATPVPPPATPTPPPPPPPPATPTPPPTAPKGPQMTDAATNSYEEYKAAGWTDQQLVEAGLMAAPAPSPAPAPAAPVPPPAPAQAAPVPPTPPTPAAPAAPASQPVASPSLLSNVDALLAS